MENGRKGWDDSLISLGLGALVVVISGILLYNFFSNTSQDLLRDISSSMQNSREEEQVANQSLASAGIVPTDTPIPLAQIQTEGQGEAVAPTVFASVAPSVVPSQEAVAVASPIVSTSPTAQVAGETVTNANEVTSTFEGTLVDSYTVQAGDSLWKIAERFYGDGFKWREIAKANNISNPRKLEKGLALSVPRAGMTSSASTTVSVTKTIASENESSVSTTTNIGVGGGAIAEAAEAQKQDLVGEREYVVQKGDNLSTIVQKQCGNNTSWVQVARDNKLANPRVIHSGNRLRISCKD
jgi:nucleoid-associated protein YgaU